MIYWLNGEWCESPVAIHIDDRGLLLGDGVFETILVRNGTPVFLDRHLQRLARGIDLLSIDAPLPNDLPAVVRELGARNDVAIGDAVMRLTVTRGPGERGLGGPQTAAATVLMTLKKTRPASGDARRLIVSDRIRAVTGVAAVCKTPTYAENIIAYNNATAAGADDAVLLNAAGAVACATTANIFVTAGDDRVATPPVADGALPGVVRAVLLECAPAAGIAIDERSLSPGDLERGAIFLTNSLIGLTPAHMTSSEETPPNALFKRLVACYQKALTEDLEQAGAA